jgi:hypothetical protein
MTWRAPCTLNPCFLSQMASHNLASNLGQALDGGGTGGGGGKAKPKKVSKPPTKRGTPLRFANTGVSALAAVVVVATAGPAHALSVEVGRCKLTQVDPCVTALGIRMLTIEANTL